MGNPLCSASNGSSEPCRRYAISGGTVCPSHGGSARQVKEAASKRLAELVHPAVAALNRLLSSDDDRIVLGAIKTVLATAPAESLAAYQDMPSPEQVRKWIDILSEQGEGFPLSRKVLDSEIVRLEAELEVKQSQGKPWSE